MTALAKDFQRKSMGTSAVVSRGFACPVAASTTIYKGALVALSASGYLVPASADRNLRVVGVAEDGADNSSGSAGDLTVVPLRGVYLFANSSTTAAVSDADIGRFCYAVDDNTVARHNAVGTRPAAGRVIGVGTEGVYVETGLVTDEEGVRDIMLLAGADLSARIHLPVKLSTTTAVSATTAGEVILGIQQNAPASGAVCIVRVSGVSNIILGDTISVGASLAVEATSGRAKAAVAANANTGTGVITGSYVFGYCITGGADGDTGLCNITHTGLIPGTFA